MDVSELCERKLAGKNIMKLQKALKGTGMNLLLMLLISLYPFLDVDSFIAIREVAFWQLACHAENMDYRERKHGPHT